MDIQFNNIFIWSRQIKTYNSKVNNSNPFGRNIPRTGKEENGKGIVQRGKGPVKQESILKELEPVKG